MYIDKDYVMRFIFSYLFLQLFMKFGPDSKSNNY